MGFTGKALAAGLACLLAAACSNVPAGRVASTGNSQTTPASEVAAIVALLEEGKAAAAKRHVSAGLKKYPNNPELMVLSDSISREPEELLGPDSFRYTVQSGETMSGLAQRFLGNRLKFYQLARYNGIDPPSSLRAGQVLNVPGRLTAPTRQSPERRPAPAHSAPAAAPPAATLANPAAAQRARSAGLAALNAGHPGQAVTLLSRAAKLDPGNAVIARDLVRAQRIAATVSAK